MTDLKRRVSTLIDEGVNFNVEKKHGAFVLKYYKLGLKNPVITSYYQYFREDESEIYKTSQLAAI